MDATDRKLLDQLQKNAKTSIRCLAEKTGLSTASVQRRMRTLRGTGAIRREVAILDPGQVGLGITAIVAVELERDRLDQIDAFKRKAREDRQVTHFYCIAGESDFILIVVNISSVFVSPTILLIWLAALSSPAPRRASSKLLSSGLISTVTVVSSAN